MKIVLNVLLNIINKRNILNYDLDPPIITEKLFLEQTVEYMNSMPGYMKPVTHYEHKYGSKGYSIWAYDPVQQDVIEKSYFPYLDGSKCGYYSFSLAYDLGSLKHLEQYGVTI